MTIDGQELLERMREFRGYVLPAHEVLAERDPEFLDGYDRMFRRAYSPDSALSPAMRELLVMALDIVAGVSPEAIRTHARKAIDHGASETQVVEAVELAAIVVASKTLGSVARIFTPDDGG
jgi:alkylhydroperoxidase/carboxymuconolactone decarboxylase family protein YurZ